MNLQDLMAQRRAIFPASYTQEPIERDLIEQILACANYAPTHKLTQPWRFRVLQGQSAQALGQALSAAYLAHAGEQASAMKAQKLQTNPTLASHLIAIGMKRHAASGLPEWEELAAVAMAVQNMWLMASHLGLGAFWSTPEVCDAPTVRELLQWEADERGLGFLYLGKHQLTELPPANRTPIHEKVKWL
jgi:nitroreductase